MCANFPLTLLVGVEIGFSLLPCRCFDSWVSSKELPACVVTSSPSTSLVRVLVLLGGANDFHELPNWCAYVPNKGSDVVAPCLSVCRVGGNVFIVFVVMIVGGVIVGGLIVVLLGLTETTGNASVNSLSFGKAANSSS